MSSTVESHKGWCFVAQRRVICGAPRLLFAQSRVRIVLAYDGICNSYTIRPPGIDAIVRYILLQNRQYSWQSRQSSRTPSWSIDWKHNYQYSWPSRQSSRTSTWRIVEKHRHQYSWPSCQSSRTPSWSIVGKHQYQYSWSSRQWLRRSIQSIDWKQNRQFLRLQGLLGHWILVLSLIEDQLNS